MKRIDIINEWFNGLDYNSLIFVCGDCPSGKDANDFIDDCDEWWQSQSVEEKEEIYNHFYNLV